MLGDASKLAFWRRKISEMNFQRVSITGYGKRVEEGREEECCRWASESVGELTTRRTGQ